MKTNISRLKILFVVSEFPPIQRNVTRTAKFVKYLARMGCDITVLTIPESSMESVDHSMDKEIPAEINICRAAFPNIFTNSGRRQEYINLKTGESKEAIRRGDFLKSCYTRLQILIKGKIPEIILNIFRKHIYVPDERMPWIPFAAIKGARICRQNIDVIYTSGPSYSNHVIGWILKYVTHLPWVADYRDPWTSIPYRTYYSKVRRFLETWMERKMLLAMDRIVVVNSNMKGLLLNHQPQLSANTIEIIPNGFDLEDFSEINAVPDGKLFTISHTGVIYPGYHVDDFFIAVQKLLEDFPEAGQVIRIRFLGDIHEQILERIRASCSQDRLSNIVSLEGRQPRQTALEVQRSSDLLLLILNEEFIQADVLTSKVFDYLAADRPILALVPPESAAGALITESGCGSAVDPLDSHAIYEVLRKAYLCRTDGLKISARNEQLINKFDRNYLAKRMYNMLFSLCKVESIEQD